jgi:hypothetical protein
MFLKYVVFRFAQVKAQDNKALSDGEISLRP